VSALTRARINPSRTTQRSLALLEHQVPASAARWLWTHNHERPIMAIAGITTMRKRAMAA
jgi:hypothetical protein